MSRRLIGTGVTDENGVVIIPYTSVGKGKMQIVAECNNVESDVLEVYDCLIADTGLTGSATDLFGNMAPFTRNNNGTTVYYNNTGSSAFQTAFKNYVSFENNLTIEFEVLNCQRCIFQTGRYETGKSTEYQQVTLTQNGKVRIEILPSGTFIYLNDNLINSDTTERNMEKASLFFRCPANTVVNFKYKNLVVY